jgi:dTDP-4-dehydrorhamnose 3,5-epimerase
MFNVIPTAVSGVVVLEPKRFEDERGHFCTLWTAEEFAKLGLSTALAQTSLSQNRKRGTVRGMHYQVAPHGEVKLVRCPRGAIWDVAVDLRPDSPTYLKYAAVELSADNGRLLYIPEGCAHGFQTLADDSEVAYQLSATYHAPSARGVAYDDPAFRIAWPLPVSVISPRDKQHPPYKPEGAK